jgi:predicted phosphodiesterase
LDRVSDSFRFIVVADSHIRPTDQEIDAYPSNALMVGRNEFIVDLCNRIDATFVVHLGDIVHPLPVEDTHLESIRLAKGVYAELRHPIHFVAGNHDVGDKPNALVAVPAVAEENYAVYEEAWGPSFHSFDVKGCRFIVIDTQLMNSGLDREHRQRSWLESDLSAARESGKRIFVFSHYPPFIRERDENEHYDNIGEPSRTWLLDLLAHHDVEAVFSGHVHNFLYNRHESTDLYVAPSTAFVRPDYAELASIPPSKENGRDDPPKLGVLVVDVGADGHHTQPIRSFGSVDVSVPLPIDLDALVRPSWESPIGVTLRHEWARVTGFPTAGLDEFNRKQVRNDAVILALLEARIRDIRVPLADLATPATADRLSHLTGQGMHFSVVSAGVPDRRSIEMVQSNSTSIDRWEIIVPPTSFASALASIKSMPVSDVELAIAPIVPVGMPGVDLHHFVAAGFSLTDDADLARWLDIDTNHVVDSLMFRVPWDEHVSDSPRRARTIAKESGRTATLVIDLPRASESAVLDDDDAVANRVAEVVRAAALEPTVAVFLDGFVDHDRGYYPRHGLIDRAFNPRPAFYRLIKDSTAVRNL